MLSKIASLCLLCTFAFWVLPLAAQTQLISSEIYETEEDLREGLELGLLTFDQYLELLDIIQSKLYRASDETGRLFFIPDVASADILQIRAQHEDIDLSQKIASFLAEKKKKGHPLFSGKLVWRLYEKFPAGGRSAHGGQEEGETENYLFCEVTSGKRMIWHIEADQEVESSEAIVSKSDLRVRRRFLKFLLYGESEFKSISVLAFYSKNRRETIENRIGAIDLGFASKSVNLGLCLSEGELKNVEGESSFSDDCRSLHFSLELESIKLAGEYALLSNQKSGLAFDLYSRRKRYNFDFSWWRYDDDFIHPHGGGISNPDYESIYLDGIDYSYRSRQAGERGIFFKSRYRILDRLSLNFSFNRWRERTHLPDKMKFRLGVGYKFSPDLSLMAYQLWTDYDLEDEETDRKTSSVNVLFSPHHKVELNLIANYRTTDTKNYGDLRLKIRTMALSPFDFVLWLKYNDPNFSRSSDGYLSFHIQERLRFFENYFVSAEYITKFYQDESRADTKAVRIKMEVLW
jgi:hypothetical protein